MTVSDAVIDSLKAIVGSGGWTSDEHELEPFLTEWRGVLKGRTPILLRPSSTEQVAGIVRTCAEHGVAIVPQGGNTGMCGGAVPDGSGDQVVLNLSRLNRIRRVDPEDFSLVAESGCVLADVQHAASEAGRLFPLSHGGQGSAQIGGSLSTNAGGINVLRYGTARGLVLGLEVVLADGRVWDGLRTLRKYTAGYDLKQLFIGSEGTLGIITAAALRLYPAADRAATAMIALDAADSAVDLLSLCREDLGDRLQAFELIGAAALELVERRVPDSRSPFDERSPWYALLEIDGDAADLEAVLASALDRGTIAGAVLAKNVAEAERFWRLRHSISEAEKSAGPGAKHDVSVPIASIAAFVVEGIRRLQRDAPAVTPVIFGHVGDGNLHYNAVLPSGLPADEEEQLRARVSSIVYDLVCELRGSISAEHGIGVLKRSYLGRYESDVALDLMRTLKGAMDPQNILNPGKVI